LIGVNYWHNITPCGLDKNNGEGNQQVMDVNTGNLMLKIYKLNDCNITKANEWLSNLETAFKESELKIACVDGEMRKADNAFWEGLPFIVIGRKNELISFLDKAYNQAPELVADHAYYWCVSDMHQDDLSDHVPGLNDWRECVLNWEQKNHNVVLSFLKGLVNHLPIIGLSAATYKLRSEIYRLAKDEHGPWSPTLILGESGVGKEMVANGIFQASSRREKKYTALACAWLTEELLQDQLFGHKKGTFTDAYSDRPGLLETNSDGAILFDDIDTAPPNVQSVLLRIMSTARGQAALFSRLGETEERETNVWLMFATNADIASLIKEKNWRDDFVFRFEDRVVHVQPLFQRQADIPALALHIWQHDTQCSRSLPVKTIKWLCSQRLRFTGNVRSFRALLSLAASMAKQPVHNSQPIKNLLEVILSRGPDYHHWVGIIATPSFTGPVDQVDPRVSSVLDLDKDCICYGSNNSKGWTPPSWAKESSCLSELKAKRILGQLEAERAGIIKAFQHEVENMNMSGIRPRPAVRLSRIVVYLNLYNEIDKNKCTQLTKMSETKVTEDLEKLEKLGLIKKQSVKRKDVWFRKWDPETD